MSKVQNPPDMGLGINNRQHYNHVNESVHLIINDPSPVGERTVLHTAADYDHKRVV